MDYAIKYYKIKTYDDVYVLVPKQVVKGEEDEYAYFHINDGDKIIHYPTTENPNLDDIKGNYIIDNITSIKDMREEYELYEEYSDADVLEFFFADKSDEVIFLKDGISTAINLTDMFHELGIDDYEEIIYDHDEENGLYLNKKIIDKLLAAKSLEELKDMIKEYADNLDSFDKFTDTQGVERIHVKDGHVSEIDRSSSSKTYVNTDSKEVTVSGLYKYLTERVIGHDKELKKIATILYLNYTSNPVYGTESILIPGPTGTGKTATFDCAASYFDVPFKNINACNLVPEGIEGTTLEDEFASILDSCNGNSSKAEKAILVFDEFDKLGTQKLDIKKDLINVFLKALEGGRFPINRQLRETRVFNTLMSSKVALGTFTDAFNKSKTIGFNSVTIEDEKFDEKLLVKKGYFSNELLSRFQHFVPYKDLTEEDKKRIILESKLSTYLMKKDRFRNQFGINIVGDEEFANGILESLRKEDKSVRDINNIIADAFWDIEFEVLNAPNKYKTLKLTRDTVSKNNYDLK
jgi:ATP-dependent Clp protease ATP-binding subunit ClpA